MPFRVFVLPVLYADGATEEIKAYLASHRIMCTSHRLTATLQTFIRLAFMTRENEKQ
jgi:hypothetical protein